MKFTDFIRDEISKILPLEYDGYCINFFWDRKKYNNSVPYVVYQTEQLSVESKLDSNYLRMLNESVKNFDYSKLNMGKISNTDFLPYLPSVNMNTFENDNTPTEYDILFYGYLSDRRKKILNNLSYKYKIKVTDNLDIIDMVKLIRKSKYVLSVGTYSSEYNDSLRITTAINLGGNILMERSSESWYDDYVLNNFSNRVEVL